MSNKETALDKNEGHKVVKGKKNENTVFEKVKVPLRPYAQHLTKRNMMLHSNLQPGSTKTCANSDSNEKMSAHLSIDDLK